MKHQKVFASLKDNADLFVDEKLIQEITAVMYGIKRLIMRDIAFFKKLFSY